MADVYTLGNVGGVSYTCLWDYNVDNGGALFSTVDSSITLNDSIENYKSILVIGGLIIPPSQFVDSEEIPVEILKEYYDTFKIFVSSAASTSAYFCIYTKFIDNIHLNIEALSVGSSWSSLSVGIQYVYGVS